MINKKILNDPVYGFIDIPEGITFSIIEHPYFQRLRRIKQLGFTELVYPGAIHTRFQHTLGAGYLMNSALKVLSEKGHAIETHEKEAALLAILLHDTGHSPFSHSLEKHIIPNYSHEDLSLMFMEKLNHDFRGELSLAIDIYKNNYEKPFFHQLVSSQLDVDRMDYLKRDSFYTGVSEGIIGSERIIKMLNIVDGQIVVEAKGIYSIEKFLIARWLMYWQVYLHKTVVSAEQLLIKIIKRAKYLIQLKKEIFLPSSLKYFFSPDENFEKNKEKMIHYFSQTDDYDLIACIKEWRNSDDKVLSLLSNNILNRKLFRIEMKNTPFNLEKVEKLRKQLRKQYSIHKEDTGYFIFTGEISNNAYSPSNERIQIQYKNMDLVDIAEASDMLDISTLSKVVKKYFLCYPKDIN